MRVFFDKKARRRGTSRSGPLDLKRTAKIRRERERGSTGQNRDDAAVISPTKIDFSSEKLGKEATDLGLARG